MPLIIEVADEVVSELNTGFSDFVATREYQPEFDLPDFDTIKCTVVPHEKDVEILTRASSQNDVRIDIGLQKKLASKSNAEIDPLLILLEQIQEFFTFKQLSNIDFTCIKAKYVPIYDPGHLRSKEMFTGVVNLLFRNMGGFSMNYTNNIVTAYMTDEIDFTLGAQSISKFIPTGMHFYLDSCQIICTELVGSVVAQPEFTVGIPGDLTKYLDETATQIDAQEKRQSFEGLDANAGETVLRLGIATPGQVSPGGSYRGIILVRGILI